MFTKTWGFRPAPPTCPGHRPVSGQPRPIQAWPRTQALGWRPAGTVSWAGMAAGVHSANVAVGLMVLGSLSTACSDVVVDSIVVERSRGEAQVPFEPYPTHLGLTPPSS